MMKCIHLETRKPSLTVCNKQKNFSQKTFGAAVSFCFDLEPRFFSKQNHSAI